MPEGNDRRDSAESEASTGGQSELLTLQEAADRLRVHYMTAYRWVRRGDLAAFKAGGRLRVTVDDLEAFLASREIDPATPRPHQRTDWPTHVDRLHSHLRRGELAPAVRLASKVVADGAPAGDAYLRLVTPAMRRIGDDWERGAISVAEEHRATEIATTILRRLGQAFRRRGPSRGVAVTLTAPEDLHSLGAAMVADFLRVGGYDVSHLGAAVPSAELGTFLRREPADVVCVSVTTPGLAEQVYGDIVGVARAASEAAIVVFGGQAADPAATAAAEALHHDDPSTLGDQLARQAEA